MKTYSYGSGLHRVCQTGNSKHFSLMETWVLYHKLNVSIKGRTEWIHVPIEIKLSEQWAAHMYTVCQSQRSTERRSLICVTVGNQPEQIAASSSKTILVTECQMWKHSQEKCCIKNQHYQVYRITLHCFESQSNWSQHKTNGTLVYDNISMIQVHKTSFKMQTNW